MTKELERQDEVHPIPLHDERWVDPVISEWYEIWKDKEWSAYIRHGLHVAALHRLFTYRSRWHAINDAVSNFVTFPPEGTEVVGGMHLVKGSRGNLVPNPLYSELRQLEETILRMEKEFGMTLRSASLIDLSLGEHELNYAELQKRKRQEARAALVDPQTKPPPELPSKRRRKELDEGIVDAEEVT